MRTAGVDLRISVNLRAESSTRRPAHPCGAQNGTALHRLGSSSRYRGSNGVSAGSAFALHNGTGRRFASALLCRTLQCPCITLPNGALPLRHIALPCHALLLHSLARLSRAAASLFACVAQVVVLRDERMHVAFMHKAMAEVPHRRGPRGSHGLHRSAWTPGDPDFLDRFHFTVLSGVCSIRPLPSSGCLGERTITGWWYPSHEKNCTGLPVRD